MLRNSRSIYNCVDKAGFNEYIGCEFVSEREWRNWQTHWT
jgi:hypothetical protein